MTALSARASTLCSLLALLLHAIYCGCYSYETRQYLTQARVDGVVQNYIYRLLGLGAKAPHTISYTLSVTSSLIAAWHAAGIVRALRASLRFRRLLLDVPDEKILHRLKTKLVGQQTIKTLADGGATSNPRFYRRWAAALHATFATYLTMDGAHFETGTNLRKSLELATPINLLYRMSRTITEPAISHLEVAVFTVNCWATPLIRWHFRHTRDPLPGRLHRHVVGLALASVFTIAVPGAIWGFVMPLVPDRALRFDQLTTTRVRLLLRHVLISEWAQVVSTRLAACMAILAIETLKKKLLVRDAVAVTAKVHAWACAALELNCHRGTTDGGTLAEIDAMLQGVDAPAVSALRFAHCVARPRLRTLEDLAIFEIYNSTITQWDADAALSERHHKYLGTIWLLHCPSADVLISHTDLTALPDDLADRWPHDLSKLAIEHSRLTAVPRVLLEGISSLVTSLAGNDLAEVPPRALQRRGYFQYLSFAGNPRLAALPDAGWRAMIVDWRGTNVSRVPQWMAERAASGAAVATAVYGGSLPLCEAAAAATRPPGLPLDCTPLPAPGPVSSGVGLVPLAELALERQP